MRIRIEPGVALLLTVMAGLGSAQPAPGETKPNIVFILADDWGWGDLSCHGHPWLASRPRCRSRKTISIR